MRTGSGGGAAAAHVVSRARFAAAFACHVARQTTAAVRLRTRFGTS